MVRAARHRNLGAEVAVKVMDLRRMRMTGSGSIDKVRKEMRVHKTLRHPNVVRLYTWFEERNFYYLIMEHVRGGDLFEFLAAMEVEQVSEDQAKYMFKQLLQAVEYLHSQNIVHRDLKPENVMLVDRLERPRLKITDFGEAKDLNGGTACKTHIGTEATMAPEVFLLERRAGRGASVKSIDGKIADVWGLGVILHVMLVISYPFTTQEDEAYRQEMTRMAAGQVSRPALFRRKVWASKSSEVKALVEGLLQAEPAKRWTILQALSCDWFVDRSSRRAGLRKSPMRVTPLKPSPHTRRPRANAEDAEDAEEGNSAGEEGQDDQMVDQGGEGVEGRAGAVGSGRKRRERPAAADTRNQEQGAKTGATRAAKGASPAAAAPKKAKR